MNCITTVWFVLRGFLICRANLAVENLALRQQLAVLSRSKPKPKLRKRDRLFWVCLSKWWSSWRSVLVIVSPATVIRWHRQGFKYYWRWKSQGQPGRPTIPLEVRRLIRRLSKENMLWGAPRIRDELRLLGHDLAASTVAKYMVRDKPPSPTWRSFLKNHLGSLASIDFFVTPTVTFQLLYVLVILRHDRRKVVHFNVTQHPTAAWVARQLQEAFPFDTAPRFLIRDRDGIYGDDVGRCLSALGLEEVLTAPRSPWQNPFVERLIGSVRRECLDHVIVLNERHLLRLLKSYFSYYHQERTHMALDGNAPNPRQMQTPKQGRIVSEPILGGLHHCYRRCA